MAGTASASVLFKGRMMTLTVLEIWASDCERIAGDIADQLARAPGFFARMPVLLSLKAGLPDLARLRDILRAADLFVVGVLDAEGETADAAAAAGLGTVASPARGGPETAQSEPVKTSEPAASARGHASAAPANTSAPGAAAQAVPAQAMPARLVTKPVRSGQQIYARGGDLVITTSVSEGAEVLADGHIHIYGALRGRALAGASGDRRARIFCRRFEPDLVAVAGNYKVADAIAEDVRSRAVQVRLEHDNLTIELQE